MLIYLFTHLSINELFYTFFYTFRYFTQVFFFQRFFLSVENEKKLIYSFGFFRLFIFFLSSFTGKEFFTILNPFLSSYNILIFPPRKKNRDNFSVNKIIHTQLFFSFDRIFLFPFHDRKLFSQVYFIFLEKTFSFHSQNEIFPEIKLFSLVFCLRPIACGVKCDMIWQLPDVVHFIIIRRLADRSAKTARRKFFSAEAKAPRTEAQQKYFPI